MKLTTTSSKSTNPLTWEDLVQARKKLNKLKPLYTSIKINVRTMKMLRETTQFKHYVSIPFLNIYGFKIIIDKTIPTGKFKLVK